MKFNNMRTREEIERAFEKSLHGTVESTIARRLTGLSEILLDIRDLLEDIAKKVHD